MQSKELLRLIVGFRRFRKKYFNGENNVYQKLSKSGQAPKTLVIACSDSRVDPAILTSSSPGDLFVVRNVANLVPPFEGRSGLHGVSSAIEFAVVNLKVKNIIVVGHRQCGGIRALMSGIRNPEPSFISDWVSIAEDAKINVLEKYKNESYETLCGYCELESIRISIENLKSFPFVKVAIVERGLTLIGAYFDLEAGKLLGLDESTGEFTNLENVSV